MNFQEFADGFETITSIISVQKTDAGYGEIRIVTGNRKYLDLIEHPVYDNAPQIIDKKFVPNSLYEKYTPKNLGFEDLCYNSAVLKKPIHTSI